MHTVERRIAATPEFTECDKERAKIVSLLGSTSKSMRSSMPYRYLGRPRTNQHSHHQVHPSRRRPFHP